MLIAYLYTKACIKYSEVLFKTVTLKPGHINKFEYKIYNLVCHKPTFFHLLVI